MFLVEGDSNIFLYFIPIKNWNEIGPSLNLFYKLKMETNENDKMKENCAMNGHWKAQQVLRSKLLRVVY